MHFSVYEIEGGALFTSHFVNVYSAQSTYTAQSCFTAAAVLVKIKKTVYLRSHPCKRSISWICISDTCRQLCVQTGGHIFFFLAIVKTILCKSIGIMHLYMNCIAVNRSVCCNITEPNSNKCWAAQQSFIFFKWIFTDRLLFHRFWLYTHHRGKSNTTVAINKCCTIFKLCAWLRGIYITFISFSLRKR